jgi:hypothetical protein
MPIALILIGLALVISGARNTYADLGATIKGDFVGQGSFTPRAGAILMIGVIGYAGPEWRKLSIGLMVLLTLAFLLKRDSGFFAQFGKALASKPVAPVETKPATPTSGSASKDNPLKTGMEAVKIAATVLAL